MSDEIEQLSLDGELETWDEWIARLETWHEPAAPSLEDIEAGRSPPGGWTRKQLAAWGVPWPPPRGWRRRLEREARRREANNAERGIS